LPAATTFGGISPTTTARAPTTEPSPTVTPGKMHAPKPIHTLEPIRIGLASPRDAVASGARSARILVCIARTRTSRATGYASMMSMFQETRQKSPISTVTSEMTRAPTSRAYRPILTRARSPTSNIEPAYTDEDSPSTTPRASCVRTLLNDQSQRSPCHSTVESAGVQFTMVAAALRARTGPRGHDRVVPGAHGRGPRIAAARTVCRRRPCVGGTPDRAVRESRA